MKANIKLIGLGLIGAMAFASCSQDFLDEKKNYDNVNADIYNDYEGANGRLNDIYSWCLPSVGDLGWKSPSMGANDMAATSTEEYAGFSAFVDPQNELTSGSTSNSVPDFFMGTANNIQEAVYGRIRNINDCIAGISGGSLPQSQKDILLGQVYFFRAWCYYNLVKWYGGVPILKEVLEPKEGVFVDRSSAKECINFILEDLDLSAKLLASETMSGGWSGTNYGRVTSGTAVALKGRVLLLWASPLFNRTNDQSRWQYAYQQMAAGMDTIKACGYELYQASGLNGAAFAKQFLTSTKNPEAVFVTLHNNITGDGLDNQKNNRWERNIRPSNVTSFGAGYTPSRMMIDLFPMSDGKIPSTAGTYSKLTPSDSAYNANLPFVDRDPRFYHTFAFPGFRWAYSGDATKMNPNNPADSKNYTLWNYVWYVDKSQAGNPESGDSYGADNLLKSKRGIYVRKKSDDLDMNPSALYQWDDLTLKGAGPFFSSAPLIEMRYAEVLLNLAEAACGAGQMTEAVRYLKQIRQRAGYEAGKEGLDGVDADQATCMSAILYERQIELAYEGKRFDDLRRWMLFDGGVGQETIDPALAVTGWGGNTCTWLGFKPLNGQRRENIEFRTADAFGVGGTTFESDPLVVAGVVRPEGVDLRKELKPQIDTLANWYAKNLKINEKRGDGYDSNHNLLYMNFRPKYYFLGLTTAASAQNKGMAQTIGWEDSNNGNSLGTFNPLAD